MARKLRELTRDTVSFAYCLTDKEKDIKEVEVKITANFVIQLDRLLINSELGGLSICLQNPETAGLQILHYTCFTLGKTLGVLNPSEFKTSILKVLDDNELNVLIYEILAIASGGNPDDAQKIVDDAETVVNEETKTNEKK